MTKPRKREYRLGVKHFVTIRCATAVVHHQERRKSGYLYTIQNKFVVTSCNDVSDSDTSKPIEITTVLEHPVSLGTKTAQNGLGADGLWRGWIRVNDYINHGSLNDDEITVS